MSASHRVLDHSITAPPPMHLNSSPSDGIWATAVHIPRSASYTYIPSLIHHETGSSRHSSQDDSSLQRISASTGNGGGGKASEDDGQITTADGAAKRNSTSRPKASRYLSRSRTQLSRIGRSEQPEAVETNGAKRAARSNAATTAIRDAQSRAGSLGHAAGNAMDASPVGGPENGGAGGRADSVAEAPSSAAVRHSPPTSEASTPENQAGSGKAGAKSPRPSMRQSMLGRRAARPLSMLFKSSNQESGSNSDLFSHASLKSLSTDRLPGLLRASPSEPLPPLPRPISSESLQNLARVPPKKKDELWSAFRGLDSDFHRFQSKTSALKANVVRSCLLPFLRDYAHHPSNSMLRPEDLDRRTMILNKWWMALLEMIDGGSSYTLSGTDRPIILEGITGIMNRPEWRFSPPSMTPSVEPRQSRPGLSISYSNLSLDSTGSDFLAESTYHNTRNLFVHNLLTQTSIIIGKLSLRHAAASLVTFAAKTLVFSFYFCPGVADHLVRLWAIPSSNIRQIVDAFGLSGSLPAADVESLRSSFPRGLHGLHFTSYASTVRYLRTRPCPLSFAREIDWHGPWTTRWCGRESDLFFVFVKQWHILLETFLPPSISFHDKARSPGFVLLYAQMMTVLKSTLHRPAANIHAAAAEVASVATTFDEVLAGADASAAALPLPAANVPRQMAENRLIMLLRDFLSDKLAEHDGARQTFAVHFVKLLETTARRVSKFDHNACFTLCDFLEEAAYILDRYHAASPSQPELIDWTFWLAVCKQISESQNTMSEIRLFAFLYSIWGIIVHNDRRKAELCLEWLLTPATFERFFCHWCPMTRAYYMRLLCWRLAKGVGRTETDIKLVSTLMCRLKTTWSQFVQLSRSAREQSLAPPPIAPSNPAPGRRLLILRDNSQVTGVQFLSFDDLAGPGSSRFPSPGDRPVPTSTVRDELSELGKWDAPAAARSSSGGGPVEKKRWALLRNIRVFSGLGGSSSSSSSSSSGGNSFNSGSSNSGDTSKPKAGEEAVATPAVTAATVRTTQQDASGRRRDSSVSPERSRRGGAVAAAAAAAAAAADVSATAGAGAAAAGAAATNAVDVRSSFRFSLEWVERSPNNTLGRLYPPSLPLATQDLLAAAAPAAAAPATPAAVALGPPFAPAAEARRTDVRGAAAATTTAGQLGGGGGGGGVVPLSAEARKYVGRALAEWTLVVSECQGFFERRRSEGVSSNALVETPTLGVDWFRRLG